MLILLVVSLCILLYVNFQFSNKDIFHPSVLFNLIFLIFSLSCLIFQDIYGIKFYDRTFIVVASSGLIFTIVSVFKKICTKNITDEHFQLKKINISQHIIIILLLMQIITIYFFITYLNNISLAFYGEVRSLKDNINLFDTMTKFWTDTFSALNVPIPFVFRVLNPIIDACSWIVLYVLIQNYIVTKKINWLIVISVGLQSILILLNGSRSPLLRTLTFSVVLYFILWRKHTGKTLNKKNYFYLLLVGLISMVAFIAMIFLMRKISIDNLRDYFFTYVGAPIENLNNALHQNQINISHVFGEQTFSSLHQYLSKLFNLSYYNYDSINVFTFSHTGIEIGNVYTTFYAFMYDFGFIGTMLLIGIIAQYFIHTYESVNQKTKSGFNFSLMIYAYLVNDLIMLAFSNRFYNTIFDAPFIKMFILSYGIYFILFKTEFKIRKRNRNNNQIFKVKLSIKE